MRGVGEATAAVTVVNALPTGVGSAVGVEIPATAQVSIEERRGGPSEFIVAHAQETPVVRTALVRAVERWFPGRSLRVELDLHSEIPVAKGLKSSSAVASAIHLAIARAAGERPTAEEVAGWSASTGREAGVSATGAFDDALAGLIPGFVVTENPTLRLLGSGAVEPGLGVVLWVPTAHHPSSPELLLRFRERTDDGHVAADLALNGDWWAAMERNTELVESVMGYDYRPLRVQARRQGAVASGVSGLGPALALVASDRDSEALTALKPIPGAEVRTCQFSRRSRLPWGGGS